MLKTLAEKGDSDSIHGRTTIGILIFQDLAVVPMMLLTPILATRAEGSVTTILFTLAESVFVVGLIIAAAWYAVPKLLEHIVRSRSRELFLLTVIVLCLGIAWLTSLGGLSLALGAFIAGLVISESEYSHQAMADVLPFRDSFNSLFFVSIGILMDWRVLIDHPVLVFGLLLAILFVKFLAGAAASFALKIPPRSAIMVGVSLAQVGEFSFLLAQQAQESGLLRGDPYQVFLSVSVLSMIVTPFLMQWSPAMARRAEAIQRLRRWLPTRTEAHVLQTEGSHIRLKDHVIIVGYGLNGRNLARVLSETEIPHLALDLMATLSVESPATGCLYIMGMRRIPTCYGMSRSKKPRYWLWQSRSVHYEADGTGSQGAQSKDSRGGQDTLPARVGRAARYRRRRCGARRV